MSKLIKYILLNICLIATFPLSAKAANDIYCPQTITCTQVGVWNSCTMSGGNPEVWQPNTSMPEYDATTFNLAEATYYPSNHYIQCQHQGQTWGYIQLVNTTSTFIPDLAAEGNKWSLRGWWYECLSSDTHDCPFTTIAKK